ncbi:MAG: GntR family transcriptional regulator [Planctomycetota bacterium]
MDPAPRIDGKADAVVSDCVYQIATGKWEPGERLPTVRVAERRWGVDRRTVMKAYAHLQARGLVVSRSRSGYFVRTGPTLERLARHRHELDSLYAKLSEEIVQETGLAPAGVFRYFAELARREKSVAFAECSRTQAAGHAREVETRLGVGCLPLVTGDLDRASRVPAGVRTLLVSTFHIGELAAALEGSNIAIHAVPIAASPDLELPRSTKEAVVLEWDATEAKNIRRDVAALRLGVSLRTKTVRETEPFLETYLQTKGRVAILAPRLFGALSDTWREHPRVLEVRFTILESAWPEIAEAIGLPLGVLG